MNRHRVRLGLVHTVPALGVMFHDLVLNAANPAEHVVEPVHVTDPWLLQTAMASGITPQVLERLTAHIECLARQDVAGILVTCSSLGEATEEIPARLSQPLPVLRIDQAMADHAVDLAGEGGRIAVLATVSSTVGPTQRLLQRSAEVRVTTIHTETCVLEEAGRARAGGDHRRHDALVADAVAHFAQPDRADVVLLAQASMAHLVPPDQLAGPCGRVPVLASPALAVQSLLSLPHPGHR